MMMQAAPGVVSQTSPFVIALFGSVLGAIIGGGGITLMARLALTEKLRLTFADREQAVTKADMATMKGEIAATIRTEVNAVIGTAENRIMREYKRLSEDLARATGAMERVAEQARADGRLAEQAMSEARLAKQQAQSLERLVDEFVKRFSHIEQSLDRIERAEAARSEAARLSAHE